MGKQVKCGRIVLVNFSTFNENIMEGLKLFCFTLFFISIIVPEPCFTVRKSCVLLKSLNTALGTALSWCKSSLEACEETSELTILTCGY